MALACAAAFVAPRLGLTAGLVTVDHGLQPGSAARALDVCAWGKEIGLDPVLVSTVDLAGPVDLSATVSAGALLAGVALVVVSCLRRPGTYGRRGLTAADSG